MLSRMHAQSQRFYLNVHCVLLGSLPYSLCVPLLAISGNSIMIYCDASGATHYQIGDNRDMPERVDIDAAFSPEALRFHDAITSKSRLAILRLVMQDPGITVPEIEEQLSLSMPMIRDSVRHLRELGYLAPEKEAVRPLRFTADRQRVGQDFAALFLALTG